MAVFIKCEFCGCEIDANYGAKSSEWQNCPKCRASFRIRKGAKRFNGEKKINWRKPPRKPGAASFPLLKAVPL